ncbi:DapH/DapD/GlmU-related protein [Limosilactobacillus fermentum]|uniref:DapH/DapD/GlmU-related protein n=1 Tax=Limosilactobacillus fermentum TaxID=1613 RepID=UPI000E4CAEA3|nr:DapH/DapD/GlmU-related protein [Limosilactobacillus fermentum]MCH5382704.1 chloramphenicol acetyltransferase [Limosilactobacillus fermentum]RGU88744.1 chloramphenicol acetyltransferase [Limosilactobacillus fermentum]
MHIEFPKLKRDEPTLGEGVQVNKTTFGQWVELGDRTLADNCTIGDYTYTGQNCYLQNSDLKSFISIAAQVRIGPTNHPYNRASQHVFAYNGTTFGFDQPDVEFLANRKQVRTTIGNDVWIGHGAIIQAGLTVGDGAVIGSGAVVTHDVEPYTIVGGVSAKKIKDRFPDEIKADLEKIAWWDWSREQLEANYLDFRLPIEEFVQKHLHA